MKQSIFETADKVTLWGRSFDVIEVFYSERIGEHIYVLEDKHFAGMYEILNETDLVRFINSAADEDTSGVDAFFEFIEMLSKDDDDSDA